MSTICIEQVSIHLLDPLLIRVAATLTSGEPASPETDSNGSESRQRTLSTAVCWSRLALSFTRQRYRDYESLAAPGFLTIPQGFRAKDDSSTSNVVDPADAALRWTARFLSIVGMKIFLVWGYITSG